MSLYQLFKTDSALENDGIVLVYDDKIKIRIARAGGSNQRYQKALEKHTKPYRRALQNETIDPKTVQRLLMETYVDSVILGWEGVTDSDGKELPFTKENVLKVFTDLPDLFADVREQAEKAALFREDAREQDVKN